MTDKQFLDQFSALRQELETWIQEKIEEEGAGPLVLSEVLTDLDAELSVAYHKDGFSAGAQAYKITSYMAASNAREFALDMRSTIDEYMECLHLDIANNNKDP